MKNKAELDENTYHVYGITFDTCCIESIVCDKDKLLCIIKRYNDGRLKKYLPWFYLIL